MDAIAFRDKSAPDLYIYCLNYLASEHEEFHGQASRVIASQSYMDDIAGSSQTKAMAEATIQDIDMILESGCFKVKGWHSNCERIDNTDKPKTTILGLAWDKTTDKSGVQMPDLNAGRPRVELYYPTSRKYGTSLG